VDTENLQRYLDSFGKQVLKDANVILKKNKKGSTALSKSIRFEVEKDSQGFTTKFYMLDYGTFVDKGVSGNKIKRGYINTEGFVTSSPYSYKNSKGHSQPPSRALDKWVVRKGIAPRDASGKFMSRKSITFLIARSIGRKGIQGISFFQNPLGIRYGELKTKLLNVLKLDIEMYLTTYTK
jgi:hypothetical protein